MSMTTDPQLLQLYLAHRASLIAYALPIVGSRARAEDVVQEAWLRFAAQGGSGATAEPILEPIGYLYRIVRNLAVDLVRRSRFETGAGLDGADLVAMAADAPSPETEVLYRDELRIVREALSELPERTRLALELHRLRGKTLQETAVVLGISVTRTHQLIARAVTHCADRLDDNDKARDALAPRNAGKTPPGVKK